MARRFLFGPVNAAFADQCLAPQRERGDCVAFDLKDGPDLTIAGADSWEEIRSRLPPGWQPDFVALQLAHRTIPLGVWSAPLPLVGLATDWKLLWHYYRRCLPACDLVLTDPLGVETLARHGIRHARVANLFVCERAYLELPSPPPVRDIDILFVGNGNTAIHRERLPWIAGLAALSDRWRVVLTTGVFGADYRALLRRARIVFNRSIRSECNCRAFEATAAGALLFQEAHNLEVPAYFTEGREYVAYRKDNLESLLNHYLEHEDERSAIAEAGRHRAQNYGFSTLWSETLARLASELSTLSPRAAPRFTPGEMLLLRSWQRLNALTSADETLATDLAHAAAADPASVPLHHALAVTLAHGTLSKPNPDRTDSIAALRRVLQINPQNALASLNLAESMRTTGQSAAALEQFRHTLALLEDGADLSEVGLDAAHILTAFDPFRVEWERAAWNSAGQPALEAAAKQTLLRWRSHAVLAEVTGDVNHYYEATLARPDLPVTRAALGCALARTGKFAQATAHLRRAVAGNPFDLAAAKALFAALGECGDYPGQLALAAERRLLAQAAPAQVPQEPWFADVRPTGRELASIIILCCNQLEFTRQCLESVLERTRPPYELLLIDNGSSDATPAYLEELRNRPGPARVLVIRNDTNRGFATGCNQGLTASRGRYLVLLNNDTIVTPGWLDGLIAWSLHDWPQVGLVGPMTSCSSPPQEIPITYRSPEELVGFAAQRQNAFAGQAVAVQRLIGFCMLFRREIWEQLGGLDEGFGLGFFEDDDLCVRVREAGYRLLMALNVFVHHFGNRTFRGLGIDAWGQLRTNFEKFRAKWGDERCVGYRLPEPQSQQPPWPTAAPPTDVPATPPRPRVSLCMIVKNEEQHLNACLSSVADLVDEMIVVDTGSTDRTKEIARQAGARVFDFQWVDSFAAARNESLRHATGDWVFWLDADEHLDETNRHRLRKLFAGLRDDNIAFIMRQFSKLEAATHGAAQVDQVRLFRNRPDIRWQYRVHEQILLAVRRSGGDVCITDIVIEHAGFSAPKVQGGKVDRNLRLFELELDEHPDDSFVLYNLGAVRLTQGQCAEALNLLQRSLNQSQPGDVLVRKLHALVGRAHHQLGQRTKALAACRVGLATFPDDGELLFWQAILLREQNDLDGAEASLLTVLKAKPPQHFTSVDAGLYSYRARHFLAEIYRDQGRPEEAEAQWRAAVAGCPDFIPAWLELAKLFLQSSRWVELDAALAHLEADPQAATEALLLRGRAHLTRKEFAAARAQLRVAIAKAPKALLPRVLLSHALLQEGRDWDAAQDALLEVLALDPQNQEAQHNLRVLRQQQHAQPYRKRHAVADPPAIVEATAPAVSLCMIVRNEEDNLPECLQSVGDLVNEIIVVDTGSTDSTKQVAQRYGAKVFDFPWIDDFAAARNESLRHARGRWIFWLDADDRLDEDNRVKLRTLLAGLKDEMAGYAMKCLCLPDANGAATMVDHLRLFRNHPQARWTFRVHEQILLALRSLHADIRWSDVVIHHTGYQDPALRQRKLQRDLQLLQLEQAEQPDHPFTLFNLGSVYQELGRPAEALEIFRNSLDRSAPQDSIVRKLYALITQCQRALGQKAEALATSRKGFDLFADDIELLFQQGVTLRELGDVAGAVDCWERCLTLPPAAHFASVNTGLRGYITRHNLAAGYRDLGKPAAAEEQWKAALAERPQFEPALRGLAELYLEQKRWTEVEQLTASAAVHTQTSLPGACIQGRLHLARKEFAAAQRLMHDAIARWPQAIEPRVLLSHSLLHEGKDWTAAQQALRGILRLDPEHKEAKHNLAVVLQNHG